MITIWKKCDLSCPALLLGWAASAFFLGCSGNASEFLASNAPYAILHGNSAWEALDQCSRPTPHAENIWLLSAQDIESIEIDLGRLQGMKSSLCCIPGEKIDAPRSSYRQYIGVEIESRRFIYINAFPASQANWTKEAIVVCDGGASFWGALYATRTRKFSNLAFNGFG